MIEMPDLMESNNESNVIKLFTTENETYNRSLEEFLNEALGPKHLPLASLVPLTMIFSMLFVTGVLGNISVCAVIIKNPAMHTATNYYLFSLAVSDLNLLVLGLPNDLSVYWQQYPFVFGVGVCKFRALLSEMVSYTSVLTIVAFSMERYLAICHPLHHYSMSGLKRAIKIIAVVWIVSMASAAPFAVYTTVNYLQFPPGSGRIAQESAFCAMLASNIPPNLPIYEISSIVFFFLPMIVILVLYMRMGKQIRRRGDGKSLSLEGSVHEKRHSSSRKAVIRMLTAVVVAFFLCWAPFHAQRLLYVYFWDHPGFPIINEWIYHVTGILYYVSSTVNPILYNVMSAKYRYAFRETLCGFVSTTRSDEYILRSRSSLRCSGKSELNARTRRNNLNYCGESESENNDLVAGYAGEGRLGEEEISIKTPNGLVMVIASEAKKRSSSKKNSMWPKAFIWIVRSKTVSKLEARKPNWSSGDSGGRSEAVPVGNSDRKPKLENETGLVAESSI